tara:strand:+ start:2597 stop:3061 length:465 start_codon:yes stop_codon:yes gene_type:complete
MSKPFTHTFGVAKYVYASAYDSLEAERDRSLEYGIKMTENNTKLQDRLSDAEFHLETSRQYAIGMSKNIAQLEAAHCEAMERAMADVERVEADNAKLRGDLRHKTLQWEGVKDMLAQRTEENAKLREQLAKADQHIKLHCSSLVNSIIRDSNKA